MCSPNVEGSWRFANVDLIPATGIMAFGKWYLLGVVHTFHWQNKHEHQINHHKQIEYWFTLKQRYNKCDNVSHVFVYFGVYSFYVPSQHISGISINARGFTRTLGKGDAYFDRVCMGCGCTIRNCWVRYISCAITRWMHTLFFSLHSVLSHENKLFCESELYEKNENDWISSIKLWWLCSFTK